MAPVAARLHEELSPLPSPDRSQNPQSELTPYARDSETKTLSLLDEALISGTGRTIDGQILKQLQDRAQGHRAVALAPTNTRRRVRRRCPKELSERGAEAKAMREILETQQKYIAESIAKQDKRDSRQC